MIIKVIFCQYMMVVRTGASKLAEYDERNFGSLPNNIKIAIKLNKFL